MNRTFLLCLMSAAAVMASCGGKVLVDGLGPNGPEGVGGAGGAATTTSASHSTSNVVGTTGSTGPAQTSSSSGPPCDVNYPCAEAITPPIGNPQLLCPGSPAYNFYQALLKCTCGGKCAASCSANTCIGQPATPNCNMCVQDIGKGCGNEFNNCANN